MANNRNDNQQHDGVPVPRTLTIRDLITIVSVCVTIALAWGVFGTRLSILEKDVASLQQEQSKSGLEIDTLQRHVRRLEIRQQDDQQFIDDIYRTLNKPLPRRANPQVE